MDSLRKEINEIIWIYISILTTIVMKSIIKTIVIYTTSRGLKQKINGV